MLMTKFIFTVHQGQHGYLHTIVTRIADGAQKYFFQCGGSVDCMANFMESMTDELLEGYFPKPNKHGKSAADNWAFLGVNEDRAVVEEQARVDLTHARLAYKV
jgi:hypothetical protein